MLQGTCVLHELAIAHGKPAYLQYKLDYVLIFVYFSFL